MWFQILTGFKEASPEQVRGLLEMKGPMLFSKINHRSFHAGTLHVPTLDILKKLAPDPNSFSDCLHLSEAIGDVEAFHQFPENAGSLFQAASQFNLLEMTSPTSTPEMGVGIYQYDHTQGPACAIACGAGTIYRNYFAEVKGQIGQTADCQIDCLEEVGKVLENDRLQLWNMKNGYALPYSAGLDHIEKHLKELTPKAFEALKGKLKIGLMWDTEVTLPGGGHRVHQAYCSALPMAYSGLPVEKWKGFARLVLEGTYEATLYAALLNYHRTGDNRVFLTLVGGGAFGNPMDWIMNAIRRALSIFEKTPLNVRFVSYGRSNPMVRTLMSEMNNGLI